jgi:hypothetical protein
LFVCCGATSGSCNTSNERIGPSEGEVVGVAVGAAAVVAAVIIIPIEINKHNHTLKGCVLNTPDGLELHTTENKTYSLAGTTADIAPGNTLRLHGKHEKHEKNTPGSQVFLVQKMQKNYGPCQALAQTTPPPPPDHP